jgi:hypothetical protein
VFQDLISLLQGFGDGKSVPGALAIALVTTAFALVGWMAKTAWTTGFQIAAARRQRRSALIMFYNFVRIRQRNCQSIYSVERMRNYLDLIARDPLEFKAYVVSVPDAQQYEAIERYLPGFPATLMHRVKMLMDYDRLLEAQYLKTGSDDFKALTLERKQAVVAALFDTGKDVIGIADDVLKEFRKYRFLRELDARIDPLLNRIEGE